MTPFIQDGDLITVHPIQESLPDIGEVVAFTRPGTGKLVVHRIIRKLTGAVLIRGDGVLTGSDGIIPMGNLLGRVTRIERNNKAVWLGLGPERYLIAWLARINMLNLTVRIFSKT